MKYFKFLILIIILIIGFYFIEEVFMDNKLLFSDILNINNNYKENYVYNGIEKSLINFDSSNLLSFLDLNVINVIDKKIIKNKIIEFKDPIVYIYNTHEAEEYKDNYNVKKASYVLQDDLLKLGIISVVESKSINKELHKRGWTYPWTYDISREYLEEEYKKNNSLKYFIDFHRDSADRSVTAIEVDGVKYASVMFILSTAFNNYKENELNIKKIEKCISDIRPEILRNTYIQEKYYYNLDISSDSYLIEIGGPNNTKEEIDNTLNVVALALYKYIEG